MLIRLRAFDNLQMYNDENNDHIQMHCFNAYIKLYFPVYLIVYPFTTQPLSAFKRNLIPLTVELVLVLFGSLFIHVLLSIAVIISVHFFSSFTSFFFFFFICSRSGVSEHFSHYHSHIMYCCGFYKLSKLIIRPV